MNVKEAAVFLCWNPDYVNSAIEDGVELPKSKKNTKLKAELINGEYSIEESELETFIAAFEAEEPGRHPPVRVTRVLLVEANHRCGVCRQPSPLQFHHIIEFSKLKHHDPAHMIATCGTDHDKIHRGEISFKELQAYKTRLKEGSDSNGESAIELFPENGPARFSWFDLRDIINALHDTIVRDHTSDLSKYDFDHLDLNEKNRLNKLGVDYFNMMRTEHEPYFDKILGFLRDPINSEIAELYYQIVDELRSKVAARQSNFQHFEELLIQTYDAAIRNMPSELKLKRTTLNILLSFMYFRCDIGRKK